MVSLIFLIYKIFMIIHLLVFRLILIVSKEVKYG